MNIVKTVKELFKETYDICLSLFKILIPLSILVKVLAIIGAVDILAIILTPLMKIMGLPGETGIVWATAMLTNIYGGIIVLVGLNDSVSLTVAQATILGTIMLMAHALLVEGQIAKKAGTRFRATIAIRVLGAVILAIILNIVYTKTGYLQQMSEIIWKPEPAKDGISGWVLKELKNYGWISVIIFSLVIFMRFIKIFKIDKLLDMLIGPVLKLIGIGKEASGITMVGLSLGLTYGGGLIIKESTEGRVKEKDVFYAVTLMGLCHSLLEDTMLMVMIGGHLSGLLWARFAFSLILMLLMVKMFNRMSDVFFYKYLFVKRKTAEASGV